MPELFNKVFLNKKDKTEKVSIKKRILENLNKVLSFLNLGMWGFRDFVNEIKHKFLNLSETNYNVGISHFRRGNIWDATFRFKFIDKKWPDYKDEKYYLAYCYALNEDYQKAIDTLNEFLKSNSKNDKALKLLNILQNNDIEELANEYEAIVKDALVGNSEKLNEA